MNDRGQETMTAFPKSTISKVPTTFHGTLHPPCWHAPTASGGAPAAALDRGSHGFAPGHSTIGSSGHLSKESRPDWPREHEAQNPEEPKSGIDHVPRAPQQTVRHYPEGLEA